MSCACGLLKQDEPHLHIRLPSMSTVYTKVSVGVRSFGQCPTLYVKARLSPSRLNTAADIHARHIADALPPRCTAVWYGSPVTESLCQENLPVWVGFLLCFEAIPEQLENILQQGSLSNPAVMQAHRSWPDSQAPRSTAPEKVAWNSCCRDTRRRAEPERVSMSQRPSVAGCGAAVAARSAAALAA